MNPVPAHGELKPVVIWREGQLEITAGLGWLTFRRGGERVARIHGADGLRRFASTLEEIRSTRKDISLGPETSIHYGERGVFMHYGFSHIISANSMEDIRLWCRGDGGPRLVRAGDRYELAIGNGNSVGLTLTRSELGDLARFCSRCAAGYEKGQQQLDVSHPGSRMTLWPLSYGRFKITVSNIVFIATRAGLALIALAAAGLAEEEVGNMTGGV